MKRVRTYCWAKRQSYILNWLSAASGTPYYLLLTSPSTFHDTLYLDSWTWVWYLEKVGLPLTVDSSEGSINGTFDAPDISDKFGVPRPHCCFI